MSLKGSASAFLAGLLCLSMIGLCSGGCGGSAELEGRVSAAAQDRDAGNGTVLYIGVMVHLEGWNGEASNRDRFCIHCNGLREYAALFEKYGARLTLEASPEFALACQNWGDNVLKEMQDRGHGIGLHADLGGRPGMTQQEFESRLQGMKDLFQSLGVEIRHVSGISSYLDFVQAAERCGFLFVTGLVEYALKAIPPQNLPQEYREAVKGGDVAAECHGTVPYEIEERMHPWRMNAGSDWLWNDPEGGVVFIPGNTGTDIKSMYEKAGGIDREASPSFTREDIDVFIAEMEAALDHVEAGKVNVFYTAWSIGKLVDAGLVEEWLQAVQPYVDAGLVQWKSLPEMYDSYMDWEATAV